MQKGTKKSKWNLEIFSGCVDSSAMICDLKLKKKEEKKGWGRWGGSMQLEH